MKDREYLSLRKRIQALSQFWLVHLGLRSWGEVAFEYETEYPAPREGDGCLAAVAKVDWQYSRLTVTFYMPGLCDMTDEQLEAVIIHELAHALVDELARFGTHKEHLEHGTCAVAQALLSVANNAGERQVPNSPDPDQEDDDSL